MSYNNFLNNKTLKSADDLAEFSILDMQNRDSKDYFFNNSEVWSELDTQTFILFLIALFFSSPSNSIK